MKYQPDYFGIHNYYPILVSLIDIGVREYREIVYSPPYTSRMLFCCRQLVPPLCRIQPECLLHDSQNHHLCLRSGNQTLVVMSLMSPIPGSSLETAPMYLHIALVLLILSNVFYSSSPTITLKMWPANTI